MAVLLPPSTSHRQITAIHSAVTSGKRNKMSTQTAPPASTNGLRRPHLGLHVLSLVAPMNGWINKPVMGPAMLRMGSHCGFAPNRRKIGFTAVWVSPKLNWTPKNPRFIQAMLPAVINGRRASSSSTVFARTSAVSTAMKRSPWHTRARYSLRPHPLQRSPPMQLTSLLRRMNTSTPAARSVPHAHVAETVESRVMLIGQPLVCLDRRRERASDACPVVRGPCQDQPVPARRGAV